MGILGLGSMILYMVVWTGGQGVGTKISRSLPIERSTVGMYFTAAVLGVLLTVLSQNLVFDAKFLWISLVGGCQSYIGYGENYANRYSLTLTSLIFPLHFVLAVVLAAVFLGEAELYRNPFMSGGAALLLGAIALYRVGREQKKSASGATQSQNRGTFGQWFLAISIMILLGGVAGFALKYFAEELDVPLLTFPSYWYPAAALFVAPVLLFKRSKNFVRLKRQDLWVPLRGAGIITQILIEFSLYEIFRLPLATVALTLGFGITVGPVLVGLLGFGERQEISRLQFVALGLALIGALLIVIF